MTMEINGRIEWKYKPKEIKSKLGLTKQANKYFATLCKKYMDPYVPFRTGALKNTAKVTTKGVYYNTPYAHAQYSNLQFSHAPGRTAEWDKTMVQLHKTDIIMALSDYIKTHAGGDPI